MVIKSKSEESEVPVPTTPFNDRELEAFRTVILEKRRAARDDKERLENQIGNLREHSGNDTAYSYHMADAGTDAMEREKLYLMIARQRKFIGYLDRALERIDNRTYGICRVTGKPIAKKRLMAVPHTELSVEAKMRQRK